MSRKKHKPLNSFEAEVERYCEEMENLQAEVEDTIGQLRKALQDLNNPESRLSLDSIYRRPERLNRPN